MEIDAKALAQRFVAPPGRRWLHVQAVAARAEVLAAAMLSPAYRDLVVAAVWLHDIGYAPELIQTGFHAWTEPVLA